MSPENARRAGTRARARARARGGRLHGHEQDLATEERERESAGHADSYRPRPMNRPHHHLIFRLQEAQLPRAPPAVGRVRKTYRYEDSGSISGLLRVRAMTMNDAHIYCTEEQIVSECLAILEMHQRVYGILGLSDFRVRLSTRARAKAPTPPRSMSTTRLLGGRPNSCCATFWSKAASLLKRGQAEPRFTDRKSISISYGDRTRRDREHRAARFPRSPRASIPATPRDGAEHRPYILHRAPLGTHERFVALLLEHFGGAFPTWLAPEQVRVVPVSERHLDYARQLVRELRGARYGPIPTMRARAWEEISQRHLLKIPNVLVAGDREQVAGHLEEARNQRAALAPLFRIRRSHGKGGSDPPRPLAHPHLRFARFRGPPGGGRETLFAARRDVLLEPGEFSAL